jgi:NDP-sugar pyrophosphorylase family protein
MMQVAILAGGLGTRLGSIAGSLPKALVPVNGRPFLAHVIDLLKSQGFTWLLVCAGHGADRMKQEFGDGSELGVRIEWHLDGPRLLGTGGALRAALPLLDEQFLVLYGDTYLDVDYAKVVEAFRASGKPALMTVFHNRGAFDESNVVFRNGLLLRYSKRDRTSDMEHIDYGLAALRRELIEELPQGEICDLADLYSRLVREGRMAGFEVERRFYQIGTPEGLAETARYLRSRR